MSELDERMNIPAGYFEEEIRDDFRITEMMKRSWAAQIHLLKILEEFFEKLDIKYTATWGTLLGTVRHKGFIPWDDDIDINISRKDFWKLLEHVDELPHDIWILSIYSSDDFYNFHAVVKNNRRDSESLFDDEREKEFCGFPFMTGIDIYILDNIPDDEREMRTQKSLYEFGYSLVHRYVELEQRANAGDPAPDEDIELFLNHTETYLQQVEKAYGDRFTIDADRPLLNELCRLVDGIASLYCDIDSKKVSSFTECPGKNIEYWGRETGLYHNPQKMPFEYTTIMAPERSKELLANMFGEDYMTPRMTGGKHEYPQYSKPAKVLGFNIEYAEMQQYLKEPAQKEYVKVLEDFEATADRELILIAYPLESLIKQGCEFIEEMEKLLENCSSLICWYAFGLKDRESVLWRSIPHTMERYEALRDKYIKRSNVLDGFLCPFDLVIAKHGPVYGEGSIIDAYLKSYKKN